MTSPGDSGSGSLRSVIGQAGSGDTIDFASQLSGQTIALTSGVIDISQSITIDGPGTRKLAVSGSGLSGVFGVSSGALGDDLRADDHRRVGVRGRRDLQRRDPDAR